MQTYFNRLATFVNWPRDFSSLILARNGFYYNDNRDTVTCYACGIQIDGWERGQDAAVRHSQQSPLCPVANQVLSSTDTASPSSFKSQATAAATKTTAPDYTDSTFGNSQENARHELESEARSQYRSTSYTPNIANSASFSTNVTTLLTVDEPWANLSLARPHNPKYPEYADESKRRQSFEYGGMIPCGQNSKDLAKAGFYYVGPQDQSRCYCCGGGLKNWQQEDDPFEEHRRWFPRCWHIQNCGDQHSQQQKQPVGMFTVEPREVKARMDTSSVKSLLEMGYAREIVRQAIETRLATKGDDFPNVHSLLEEVMKLQDQESISGVASSQIVADGMRSMSLATNQNIETNDAATGGENQSSYATGSFGAAENSSAAAAFVLLPNDTPSELLSNPKSKAKKKKRKNKSRSAAENPTQNSKSDGGNLNGEETQEDDLTDPDEIQILEENKSLKEARTCKVCAENEVNTVFLPCGHLICCSTCSPKLRNCAICRALIKGTVKVFLS